MRNQSVVRPLHNETVRLFYAKYNPTRKHNARWAGTAVVDGMDVTVDLYNEDVRFLERLGVPRDDRWTHPAQNNHIPIRRDVVLRWEQRHGYRVDGAYIDGEYVTVEQHLRQLQAKT